MAGEAPSRFGDDGQPDQARGAAGSGNDSCARGGSVRAALSLTCEARQGLQPWARVRLDDLSPGGFRLVWPSGRLDPRQPIRLRVPGLQLMTARIRWVEDALLGCAFENPLHVAVFKHIVQQATAQASRR